jgi:hypothetical protein
MSYDAKSIWQHHHLGFKRTIHAQPTQIVADYIDQCCGSFLLQGTPWTIVVQLRSYMMESVEKPFQPRKLDFGNERETPQKSLIISETRRSVSDQKGPRIPDYTLIKNQIVPPNQNVRLSSADWKRTKIQIELYNKRVHESGQLLEELLIQYQEL